MSPRPAACAVAAALALAGCKLVDQRTFGAAATPPSAAALNRPGLPNYPLLTLPMADPSWRSSVDNAVIAATARKPGVAFEVVAPVPTSASADRLDRATKDGLADTAMVADALRADGIADERITLGLQGDAGNPPREVLLYVH